KNIHLETKMYEGIEWIGKMSTDEDLVIIHISAHGISIIGEKRTGYGIKLDKDYSYSDVNKFIDVLDKRYRHLILIVDACYSGGFIEACQKDYRWIITACEENEYEYGNKMKLLLRRFSPDELSKTLFTHNMIKALKNLKTKYGPKYGMVPLGEAFINSKATLLQRLKAGGVKRPHPRAYFPYNMNLFIRTAK
ncbi:unnamed protein product, partial [marine sediment metagenome]